MKTVKAIFNPKPLVAARKNAGLKQTQLADRAGVGQSLISDIERGECKPSVETLATVCHILDICMTPLFFYEEINDNTDK